jgi:hypothetical protein
MGGSVISHAFFGPDGGLGSLVGISQPPARLFPQFIEHLDNPRKPIQPTLGSADKHCVRDTKGKRRRSGEAAFFKVFPQGLAPSRPAS